MKHNDAAALMVALVEYTPTLKIGSRTIHANGKIMHYVPSDGRLYRRMLWVFRRYYTLQEATVFFL